MPTNNTPPRKSQFGNYIALIIFGILAALAWLMFIVMAWANRGAFHGSDFFLIHMLTIAPAVFLTSCAYTIRRQIRRARTEEDQ